MNFIAHAWVAREFSPEFRYGAMLPDFAGMAGAKILKPAPETKEQADILNGIEFHYRTDVVFDNLTPTPHKSPHFV